MMNFAADREAALPDGCGNEYSGHILGHILGVFMTMFTIFSGVFLRLISGG